MRELFVLTSILSVERFTLTEVRLGLVTRGESARQQSPNLAQLILIKPQLSHADATDALEHLEQHREALDDEQRKELASVINACLQSGSSVALAKIVKRTEPQRHEWFNLYCSESL